MYKYAISFPDEEVLKDDWQENIAAARLKRIEFSCSQATPWGQMKEEIGVLDALCRAGKVETGSIHIPFGGEWNIGTLDEAKRAEAVRLTVEFIEACEVLHCRNYTLHGSAEPNKPEERMQLIEAFRAALSQILPTAVKQHARLNVELLPRTCLANTAEELAFMIEPFPTEYVGVCFDVNHLCGHAPEIPDYIRTLGPRIQTFHFSDYDGADECHWYPGMGVIDWDAVMGAIRSLPNDVIIIFETDGFLQIPKWQQRRLSPKLIFDNALLNIFRVENYAAIKGAVATMKVE